MQVLTEANDEETIWDEKSHIMNIVPLFDCNDEVMAYYVEISPCGYMIINADVNNPDVLEFAYDQGDYSEIYCEYKNGNRIYYNGFGTPLIKKGNDYYFIGNNSDEKISEVIYKQNINILKNTINSYKITAGKMKKAIDLSVWMKYIGDNSIVTFNNLTFENNMVIVSTNDYGIIGSGSLPSGVDFGTIRSWSALKSHLAYYDDGDNHMLYLLIWNGLEAHYVNGVGYHEYSSGEKYVRIFDNWNKNINRYISYTALGVTSEVGYCDIYSLY